MQMRSILLIASIILLSGCEVLKGKQSKEVDAVNVNALDSGSTKKSTTDVAKEKEYDRVTVNYPPFPRDCTVNNYHTYPSSVIYERGKETENIATTEEQTDWKRYMDSTAYSLKEELKSKETKVMTQWYIWVILGLVGLIAMKILLPFKISRI
jgi:hypothetical protein